MMLGNLYVREGRREQALAAYRHSAKTAPPGPFRKAIEDQITLVSTHPIDTIVPLRDPSIE
jgi:cytochrome c-type biogenesis protein CcmH/NrfG